MIKPNVDLKCRNINITRKILNGENFAALADEHKITKSRIAQIARSTLRKSYRNNFLKTGERSELLETLYIQKRYVENKYYWLSLLKSYEQ
jgi:hypothetical protein